MLLLHVGASTHRPFLQTLLMQSSLTWHVPPTPHCLSQI
jgi:hypothetical protein